MSADNNNNDDDDTGSVASYDSFSDDDDFEYKNRRIAKSFYDEGAIFFGTVVKYKPPDLWHIVYDDDDSQDMDEDDLRRAFRLYQRKKHRDQNCPKEEEEAVEEDKKESSSSKDNADAVANVAAMLAAEVDAEVAAADNDTVSESTKSASAICDVCQFKDGHQHLVLLKCIKCQLNVHRECYGLQSYSQEERDFICFACEAVGKEIPAVEHKTKEKKTAAPPEAVESENAKAKDATPEESTKDDSKEETANAAEDPSLANGDSSGKKSSGDSEIMITQSTRPRHCVLCNHNPPNDTAVHAMHPIYDTHGPNARQKAFKDKDGKLQLAWAHSLCAFVLTQHKVLYGVQANGTTHEGQQEDLRDKRSKNPFLKEEDEIIADDCDFGDAAPMHHFVYYTHVGEDKSRDTTNALSLIKEYRANPCCVCNQSTVYGMEIPIQCLANDKYEYHRYRGTHKETLKEDECCTTGIHVGCGQWRPDNKPRRVLYFPGSETSDPVKAIYCNVHAPDITAKKIKEFELKRAEETRLKRERAKQAMARHAHSGTVKEEPKSPHKKKLKKLKLKKLKKKN